MNSSFSERRASEVPPSPLKTPGVIAVLSLLSLGCALLIVLLGPQWLHNPDLSHGLFMPLVFVALLWEGRRRTAASAFQNSRWKGLSSNLLLLASLALLAFGTLYALAFGWDYGLCSFAVSLAFSCAGIAALLRLGTGPLKLISFSWPSVTAFLLWPLCAPLPPGSYTQLTSALQSMITSAVVNALNFLGVAAMQRGNIIELANALVGVEEACSGVRSLVSCVFAGLFFSASLIRRPLHRILLVILSALLAIGMNFLRSLLLTLLVNQGVDIKGAWHDLTGFSILACTAILLGLLALHFSRTEEKAAKQTETLPEQRLENGSVKGLSSLLFCYSLGLCLIFAGFLLTRPIKNSDRPGPDIEEILPLKAKDWLVVSAPDLLRFSEVLHTNKLVQRDYRRRDAKGIVQVTIYLAYWAPGQSNPSQVALHTPDGCWPGAGWKRQPWSPSRGPLTSCGLALPEAEQRLFSSADGINIQHVWYWHLFDGHPIVQLNPYNVRELLEMSLRYGFRRNGDQLFIRVSSNRPWKEISQDPLFGEIFRKLENYGL
jgi:exosortase